MYRHLRNTDEAFGGYGKVEKSSRKPVLSDNQDVVGVDVSLMTALGQKSECVAPTTLHVEYERQVGGSCGAYGPCGGSARCWELCEM
jgi:hypothetical protein